MAFGKHMKPTVNKIIENFTFKAVFEFPVFPGTYKK